MFYLNDRHKELMQKSMRDLKELHKQPIDYDKELQRHKEMGVIARRMEEESLTKDRKKVG